MLQRRRIVRDAPLPSSPSERYTKVMPAETGRRWTAREVRELIEAAPLATPRASVRCTSVTCLTTGSSISTRGCSSIGRRGMIVPRSSPIRSCGNPMVRRLRSHSTCARSSHPSSIDASARETTRFHPILTIEARLVIGNGPTSPESPHSSSISASIGTNRIERVDASGSARRDPGRKRGDRNHHDGDDPSRHGHDPGDRGR